MYLDKFEDLLDKANTAFEELTQDYELLIE